MHNWTQEKFGDDIIITVAQNMLPVYKAKNSC
jgi:hypothetical protein